MLILPEHIHQKPAEKKILALGGATLIDYRQDYNQSVYETCMTQHLLAFVLGGEKQVHVGGEVFSLQAGEAFFLRRGEYAMSEIAAESGPFSNVLFFLEPALIDAFLGADRAPAAAQAPFLRVAVTPLVQHFIDSLPVLLADPFAGSAGLLRCKLLELLHYLAASPENPGFRGFLQQLNTLEKNDLVAFMARHGDAGHDLAQLARLSGRSLASFKRDFTRLFGEPPGGWLRRRRLAHFIRAFRLQYGVTPKVLIQERSA